MKKPGSIYENLISLSGEGKNIVLASVVARRGSAPMSSDAKMIITEVGSPIGTVGGGCLEAEVWQAGQEALKDKKPRILDFMLTEREAAKSGHICGGAVKIYIEIIDDASFYKDVFRMITERERGAIAKVISLGGGGCATEGIRMLFSEQGIVSGDIENPDLKREISNGAKEVLKAGTPKLFKFPLKESEAAEVFIEPLIMEPRVLVFGGGHISFPLVKIAKMAGFKVTIIDDRPFFANKERFPDADDIYAEDFFEVFKRLKVDSDSYLVIVTRGHEYDQDVLEWALQTEAKYIGMIGSKNKIRIVYRNLEQKGIQKELFERVNAPIGIYIGAETPEEIAVSIVAEMIKVKRGV